LHYHILSLQHAKIEVLRNIQLLDFPDITTTQQALQPGFTFAFKMPGFNNLSVASFSPATGERTAQPKPKLRSSCDKCRSAKVRCDKNKPRCERCTARKVHCNYSVARKPNIAKTRHTSEATTPEPKTGSSDIPEYTNNEHFMQFPTNMDNPASRCSMPFLDTHGAVPKSGLQQDETSDFLDLKPHSSEISSFEPIDTSHCEKLVCDISHRLSIDLDGCNTGEHLIHTMDQVVKSRQAIDDLTELLGCRTPRSAMLCASLPAKQSIPCNYPSHIILSTMYGVGFRF